MTASAPTPNPPVLPVLAPAGPGWRLWRLAAVLMLGFASGLPLALTGQAMQAWLSLEGIDVATIGFLSLVGLPYTFKFLWAPLMDRFDPPWLGRRRGWLVLTQLLLAGALLLMAGTSPKESMRLYALLAVAIAFLSASQDVVIDAYRTDLLPAPERGLGASLSVLGYRLAMILSGGIALIWTDPVNAGGPAGWTWPEVYRLMALLMVAAAGVSALLLPRLPRLERPESVARNDLIGFAAVLAAAAVGYLLTDRVLGPLSSTLLGPLLEQTTLAPTLRQRWADLLALLAGIAITLPLGAWAARVARFETLLGGMASYFAQPGAWAFLGFIVLYKLGDAFAGSLTTAFLIRGAGFSPTDVGVVNKGFGLVATLIGALAGGLWLMRLGLYRSLMLFGILQALTNLGFFALSLAGHNYPLMVLAVGLENLAGGMGTAAFVALIMGLCDIRYSATQFALLSALASLGRVFLGPVAGGVVAWLDWPLFFVLTVLAALPGLWLLSKMRPAVEQAHKNNHAPAAEA